MTKIGSCLPWFLAKHHGLGINQAEGINHYLPFHALDWIHNHSNSPLIQSFKTLRQNISITKHAKEKTKTKSLFSKMLKRESSHQSSKSKLPPERTYFHTESFYYRSSSTTYYSLNDMNQAWVMKKQENKIQPAVCLCQHQRASNQIQDVSDTIQQPFLVCNTNYMNRLAKPDTEQHKIMSQVHNYGFILQNDKKHMSVIKSLCLRMP